ncbi:hypothetical protein [Arsukibacterium indicum]|uniref:Uncharacterized protein n=1 Tax=Arsukibacterium indicum TaxID=2848612 RepID=A0ABS6MLM0_9GAMM|nr:hypothetical protein [Arsukibacterium indicum]MBV2129712.1 hypothetical protein [Arsukibacterium indicum]
MITKIQKTDSSALSLILYAFQFERITDDFSWDERHQNKLANLYDINKLKLISEHINHYFVARDLDLSNVLPPMNASAAEKELLLKNIQIGLDQIIGNY